MPKKYIVIVTLCVTLYAALFPVFLSIGRPFSETADAASVAGTEAGGTEYPDRQVSGNTDVEEDAGVADVSPLVKPDNGSVQNSDTVDSTSAETGVTSATLKLAEDETVTVRVLMDSGAIVDMSLHDYLIGVLAAEVPGDFEPEALKAQAVAARTFVFYRMLVAPCEAHPEADVCTDSHCCISWADEDAMHALWGDFYDAYYANVLAAVESTDGECVFHGKELILAAFHCASAGYTEECGAVWEVSLPYLVSVSSPETSSVVPDYIRTLSVSLESFADTVKGAYPEAVFGDSGTLFSDFIYDDSGRLVSLKTGGVTLTGNALRQLFGLRSTAITAGIENGSVVFTTVGSGHGVGLSQYGAETLAASGYDYVSILQHYYTGTYVARIALYLE